MSLKILCIVVFCAVVSLVNCERNFKQYTRIKRGKYYSNPPPRFYSRPPSSFPNRGFFSYTPPPNFKTDDEPSSYPVDSRPPKVSKPTEAYSSLGEEDLNNLIKYLSKQDLDRIIEYAGKNKGRYEKNDFKSNKNVIKYEADKEVDDNFFKAIVEEVGSDLQLDQYKEVNQFKNQLSTTQPIYSNPPNIITPIETKHYGNPAGDVIFTDSKTMPEEELPRPMNLREDDYEVSFTNNVPTIVRTDPNYEVKNFGDLPLMNYNSKLDTQSSYHVPHYTVTSQSKPSSTSYSSSNVPLEPAPPPSAARSQSDAHLKAVKIWSHRSTGTAYTLHDDGSLSLEKTSRPRSYNGYP